METNNRIFEEKPKSSLTKVLEILSQTSIEDVVNDKKTNWLG